MLYDFTGSFSHIGDTLRASAAFSIDLPPVASHVYQAFLGRQVSFAGDDIKIGNLREYVRGYNLEINNSEPVMLVQTVHLPELSIADITSLATHYSRTGELPSGWKIVDESAITVIIASSLETVMRDTRELLTGDGRELLACGSATGAAQFISEGGNFGLALQEYVEGTLSLVDHNDGEDYEDEEEHGDEERSEAEDSDLYGRAEGGSTGLDDTGGATCG